MVTIDTAAETPPTRGADIDNLCADVIALCEGSATEARQIWRQIASTLQSRPGGSELADRYMAALERLAGEMLHGAYRRGYAAGQQESRGGSPR